MKKLILILIILSSALVFGQGWNTTVQTDIEEGSIDKLVSFTNRDGIHIVIKIPDDDIVYYRLDSEGDLEEDATITTSGDYPAIAGTEDEVYIFYRDGSNIKGKYSTNAGSSWTALDNISTTSNDCNGIDAIYDPVEDGIHVVYGLQNSGSNYETYYTMLDVQTLDYEYAKTVTDYTGEVGGNPSVTFSEDMVHVSYNKGYWNPPSVGSAFSTRDRDDDTWEAPQDATNSTDVSTYERLVVAGNTLYLLYSEFVQGIPNRNDIAFKTRSLSGTSWGSGTDIETSVEEGHYVFNTTATYNEDVHLIYAEGDELIYESYDGSWSGQTTIDSDVEIYNPRGISSVSNEVFLAWKTDESDYLRYKQWNDNPLAPQGLDVQPYMVEGETRAKLTWTLNQEPDVKENTTDGYKIERRTKPYGGSWSSWLQIAAISGNYSAYVDVDVIQVGADKYEAEYRLRAKDVGGNISIYSSVVSITFGQWNKISAGEQKNTNERSQLFQNYPNPFNPSTKIIYSLQKDAYVSIKVYDMLGNEVAELVNVGQIAGIHEISFDASELSSGIYIYRVTVMNGERILYSESKQMTLLK